MKKRSLWIIFLTALLCLSMLFAACDSSDADDIEETSATESESESIVESETPTDTVAPEPLETEERPVDAAVNYESIIDIWLTYFSYTELESEKDFTKVEKLFEVPDYDYDYDDIRYDVTSNGYIYILIRQNVRNNTTAYTIYNVKTGKKILTMSESYSESEKELTREYSYDYNSYYGFITVNETLRSFEYDENDERVTTVTRTRYCYDLNGELLCKVNPDAGDEYFSFTMKGVFTELAVTKPQNKGTDEEPEIESVTTYTYFDKDGKIFANGIEEPAVVYDGALNAVRLDGKNYYYDNGEVIFSDENIVPVTIANDFGSEKFEYLNYNYYATSSGIKVVNTDTYKIVADYTVLYEFRTAILPNGNVYIYSYAENENIFDSEYVDGSTFLRHNVLLDVTTGEATEIDLPYIVLEMITPQNLDGKTTAIKDSCAFASVLPVNNGKIARDVEFVIFDSQLEKIATLPKLVKNQIDFVGMIGEESFEIVAESTWGQSGNLIADGETNTVYPARRDSYVTIENGFIVTEGVNDSITGYFTRYHIYNNKNEKVAELDSTQWTGIYDGRVIHFTEVEKYDVYDYDNEDGFENDEIPTEKTERVYKVGYINAEGEFVEKKISTDANTVQLGAYDLWTVNYRESGETYPTAYYLYNVYGDQLKVFDYTNAISILLNIEDGEALLVRSSTPDGDIYYIVK